ncbi:Slp family lipoprotein [Acerihabitans sp. TG2]|nr:Slp family lipoprotein [Acerihabitans sp. TG2]MEA9389493.1 Slp family lipoprotein [Acerihabitans sp. TG2]
MMGNIGTVRAMFKVTRVTRGCRRGGMGMGLALILALSGCATVPQAVRGTSATPQQDLVRVLNAPSLYVGQEARFGGKVVKVTNLPGRTRLEITSVGLDDSARPQMHLQSDGRIVAYVNGFLEPADFDHQWVTVVGPIVGTEQGTIGQTHYTFVVIRAEGYKRWQLVRQIVAPMGPPMSPWGWDGRYGRGWGPDFGMGYGYGNAEVENVLE